MMSFTKKFKVDKNHYIYDVNSNEFFKVNELVYSLIDNNSDNDKNLMSKYSSIEIDKAKSDISHMKANGYFSSNRPEITFFHSIPKKDFLIYLSNILDHKLYKITLLVTESCNLRCNYCVYSGTYVYHRNHSEKMMDIDTMKKSVDFYFSHSDEILEKHISFYGGEPLMNFKLIKECVNYIKSNYNSPIEYNMTTNGTLLDKKKIKFLVENKFSLLISLDGPKTLHDRHRVFKNGKGTFDSLTKNLQTFHCLYPEYYKKKVRFNVVLAPPYDLKALKNYFSNLDIKPANISFADVSSKSTQFFERFDPEDLKAFSFERLENLHSFYKKLFHGEKRNEFEKWLYKNQFLDIHRREMKPLPKKYPSHGQCMLGERSLLINTNGSFNFCTQVEDVYNLGNIHDGYDYNIIEKIYFELNDLLKKKCYDCWAIRFCMKCIKKINKNGRLNEELLNTFCEKNKKRLLSDFQDYIKIREHNYHALDYLADIVLS